MMLLNLCVLLRLSHIRLSLQAPTNTPKAKDKALEQSRSQDDSSLISLLQKPHRDFSKVKRKRFGLEFSDQPHIKKLNSLSHDESIDHADKLARLLHPESKGVKFRFNLAIEDHMKRTNMNEKQQHFIKARIMKTTKILTNVKGLRTREEKGPNEEAKKRRNATVVKSQEKAKKRKLDIEAGRELTFAEQLADAGVPDDATASDIEEASRHFINDGHLATSQLRQHLQHKGFPKAKIRNTIAARSLYMSAMTTRARLPGVQKVYTRASTSQHGTLLRKKDAAGASNNQGENTPPLKRPIPSPKAKAKASEASTSSDVYSSITDGPFDDTEWWAHM